MWQNAFVSACYAACSLPAFKRHYPSQKTTPPLTGQKESKHWKPCRNGPYEAKLLFKWRSDPAAQHLNGNNNKTNFLSLHLIHWAVKSFAYKAIKRARRCAWQMALGMMHQAANNSFYTRLVSSSHYRHWLIGFAAFQTLRCQQTRNLTAVIDWLNSLKQTGKSILRTTQRSQASIYHVLSSWHRLNTKQKSWFMSGNLNHR